MTVAALYAAPRGVYFGVDGVDPWDISRDARTQARTRSSRTRRAGGGARWAGDRVGQDDGCFEIY